jgi:uncharacterized membrane protein
VNARWLRRIVLLLLASAAVHALAVWALPRLIMHRVIAGAAPARTSGVFLPPMTDDTQRRIVMPSPDLLYATCAYDVRERPLHVRADPKLPRYWSIALYASNTDNWFVLNDRVADGRPVDLVITAAGAPVTPLPDGAVRLESPTDRGLLLMRLLVADYEAEREALEAARATLRCESLRG